MEKIAGAAGRNFIFIQGDVGTVTSDRGRSNDNGLTTDAQYDNQLVWSKQAEKRHLYITYSKGDSDYDAASGVFTFTNLSVVRRTDNTAETLNTIPALKIRVLAE